MLTGPCCSHQVAEREARVSDLEVRAAEMRRQQQANEAAAAQLTARSEAATAEAQAARDAAEVRYGFWYARS